MSGETYSNENFFHIQKKKKKGISSEQVTTQENNISGQNLPMGTTTKKLRIRIRYSSSFSRTQWLENYCVLSEYHKCILPPLT